MTPLAAQPLDVPADVAGEYQRALATLPADVVAAALARLDAAVADAERSGDLAPVRHVLDSLLGTARLGRNAEYLDAVAEADAGEAAGGDEPEDVAAFVARMRTRHGR